MIELEDFVINHSSWLFNNHKLERINDNEIILETPFLDRHNDCIEIHIREKENSYLLSDMGNTLAFVLIEDIKSIKPSILNGLGVTFEESSNELWKVSANWNKLPLDICMLTNAIVMVNGILDQNNW